MSRQADAAGSRNPLRGAKIIITRPEEDGGPLAERIAGLGGEARCISLVRIEPPIDPGPLRQARRRLNEVDWIALTSRHAARSLLEEKPGPPADGPASGPTPRIAAVGRSTAAAARTFGWPVDLVATGRGGETLAEAMIAAGVRGQTVLYPRSDLASDVLIQRLTAAGAEVHSIEAYRTAPPGPAAAQALRSSLAWANGAVFASPSAVGNFADLVDPGGGPFVSWVAIAIGATTATAIRQAGFALVTEADRPGDEGLLAGLVRAWDPERCQPRAKRKDQE